MNVGVFVVVDVVVVGCGNDDYDDEMVATTKRFRVKTNKW